MLPTLVDDPRWYDDKVLTPKEILGWFDVFDAGWMHDGDSKKSHAELSSGKCSNAFFDCMRILCHPNLCEILAIQLARKIKECGHRVDWVIGSPYAAITFSYEVVKALKAVHGFAEKDPDDPNGKKMVWRRMTIPRDATILNVEELITTSGTFREVRRAIGAGNSEPVNFLPFVGTLIHRPPELPADYGDTTVISLVEKEVWAVLTNACPLCNAGSARYRPKTHWRELTGKA